MRHFLQVSSKLLKNRPTFSACHGLSFRVHDQVQLSMHQIRQAVWKWGCSLEAHQHLGTGHIAQLPTCAAHACQLAR